MHYQESTVLCDILTLYLLILAYSNVLNPFSKSGILNFFVQPPPLPKFRTFMMMKEGKSLWTNVDSCRHSNLSRLYSNVMGSFLIKWFNSTASMLENNITGLLVRFRHFFRTNAVFVASIDKDAFKAGIKIKSFKKGKEKEWNKSLSSSKFKHHWSFKLFT